MVIVVSVASILRCVRRSKEGGLSEGGLLFRLFASGGKAAETPGRRTFEASDEEPASGASAGLSFATPLVAT
jgi:hypothetical protein